MSKVCQICRLLNIQFWVHASYNSSWLYSEDDSTQQDMFNNDSDEGEIIEEDHEAKWRQERFEREKFLQEQEASSLSL